MLVTITTDASFYDTHKMGGYAFWITSNSGRIRLAAAFKGNVETSHDAEFKCIINALHSLKKSTWDITEIYINTDSKDVMKAIDGTRPNLPKYAVENLTAYKAILKELKVSKVSLRHVKGHKHTKTARHWCNQWCHDNSKAAAKSKIFG